MTPFAEGLLYAFPPEHDKHNGQLSFGSGGAGAPKVTKASEALDGISSVDQPAPENFTAFYEREAPRLMGFVVRLGADPHLAADVVQACFVTAFRQWGNLREPRAWLRRVAERKLMRLRDRSRPGEDPVAKLPDGEQLLAPGHRSDLVFPEAALEVGEQADGVRRLIGELPLRQRQVMAWTVDGYSAEETAKHLGMTPVAVRKNLSRARTTLKDKLTGGGRDDGASDV
ncbi:sigma-70 family RNA polymerase sigma factor [Nonomuraea sp. NPDC026600]|uniref:RNA polymerase sigma factor n=1 Tax=Nonomuraea sp. NPDC026600 TaxID=3155363 RepID=UPI0033E8A374